MSQIEFSEVVNEIMQAVPTWPIRLGISILFAFFLLIIIIISFIPYPRMIDQDIRVISQRPISRINSPRNGFIEKIYFKDGSMVNKGEVLASLNGDIELELFYTLQEELEKTQQLPIEGQIKELVQLGKYSTLEPQLHRLITAIEQECLNFLVLKWNSDKQIQSISFRQQRELIRNQADFARKELEVEKVKYEHRSLLFKIDSLLYQDSVISYVEFRESYLQDQSARSQLIVKLKEEETFKAQMEELLIEEQRSKLENETAVYRSSKSLEQNVRALISYLNEYEKQNYLLAPVAGIVHYSADVAEGKLVDTREQLMIIETQMKSYLGIVSLELEELKLSEIGQKVLLELAPYPALEYGRIEALVSRVGEFDVEGSYFLEVELPSPLITDQGKELNYYPEMKGKARVIVEERTLLQRLLNKFLKWS